MNIPKLRQPAKSFDRLGLYLHPSRNRTKARIFNIVQRLALEVPTRDPSFEPSLEL
jgi:hypothetical protein